MQSPLPPAQPSGLQRTLTLRGAVALNMLDMIGVGPFITLPLIIAAMGGPQAMLGWILGALLAVADGLVWAELGAAMPEAGGSYRYLREIFGGRAGRFLAFVYLFQLSVSVPLSAASGCIGLSQYAAFVWPGLLTGAHGATAHAGQYSFGVQASWGTLVAVAAVVLAIVLQYRSMVRVRAISIAMWTGVLLTIAFILLTGVTHAHWAQAFDFPPNAWHLDHGFFLGLGSAMLVATYDYWGYYNVCFLGGEVEQPERNIPRAILLSIGLVAVLYLTMNISVLAVVPWREMVGGAGSVEARRAVIAVFMERAYGGAVGWWAGRAAALLVMMTAFASVFSVLMGGARVPYAAAAQGEYFPAFARLHPRGRFPYVALLSLGATACLFCFFDLRDVIAGLVVVRIVVQMMMQHIGVIWWRMREPNVARPFRMWWYPVPAMAGLTGFAYVLLERQNFRKELVLAAVVIVLASATFLLWHAVRTGRRPRPSEEPA